MSISIISQPNANSLNAAYRPIIIKASISGNPPVTYCDIYFNAVYYKTITKTQGSAGQYEFDVQNAAKEYLRKFLAPNGGTSVYNANTLMAQCYVKIRSSVINISGFIDADLPVPVQGTGSSQPIAGGGTQSTSFFILNATLQHEDNQDVAAHLNSYKTGNWMGNVYPLTHRQTGYGVGKGNSDYFPVVSLGPDITGVNLHYKLKTSASYASTGGGSGGGGSTPPTCTPVGISFTLPDATVGQNYFQTIPITGSAPFTGPSNVTKPAWMQISVSGSTIVVSGTPTAAATGVFVSFSLTNCDGINNVPFSDTINIVSRATAWRVQTSSVYCLTDSNGYNTGMQGWHTLEQYYTDDSSLVSPSSTKSNVSADADYVAPVSNTTACPLGARFGFTTFNSGDASNESESTAVLGLPNTTVTVKLTSYSNTNGGELRVGAQQAFLNMTWTVVLNGSGVGTFSASIVGNAANTGTVIRGVFTITAVSSGVIGSPSTYQISKVF